MSSLPSMISIGALAARSGASTPTLRFYESLGLISSTRSSGNQRRYARETLRRVAVIRAAHGVGLSLAETKAALDELPAARTPNAADWQRLSSSWRQRLDAKIADLRRLRDSLTGCIGCGCLSLDRCALLNPADTAARRGPGARFLLGGPPGTARGRAGRG
jgi:MerR family redox-sensitive transcriptional activator SoxR